MIHLRIITPRKIVLDREVNAVTVPSAEGELTILAKHENLFALLNEGIVRFYNKQDEQYLAIGGGYVETNGRDVNVLVSRAYGQSEIDRNLTEKAVEQAKKTLSQSKDEHERLEASALLRRSLIDIKLLKKRKNRPAV